jgi:fibronectin type 3 domain-containing protein
MMWQRIKSRLAMLLMVTLAACGGGGSDAPAPTPPASPASLSVEPADGATTIQWPAVADATSYNLYWSETTPVTVSDAQVIEGAVSPYTHAGRSNGRIYYYAVTAINADGESDLSAEVGAMPVAPVPAAPQTVNAVAGDTQVTIDWAPVSRAESYNLYWSRTADVTPGGPGVTRISGILTTSYAHLALNNLERYHYVITAVNSGGESVLSAEVSAVPVPPAPGAPANLTATAGDAQVQLAWSASLDASAYNLYWSNAAGVVPGAAGVTQIPGLVSTSHVHAGLTNGLTYHYVVTSVGPGGESAPSVEVAARPLPPPPPAPLGLTAIAPKDVIQVAVQWFDVTDYPSAAAPIQLGYHLYRGTEPGLAGYYKDASRATKFSNVTAPFVDASVVRATTYYYVVTAFVPSLPEVESVVSGEVSATTGRAGGGGGGDSGYGNNLSFPLVLADGYGLTGAPVTGAWPGVGPFSSLPAFDFNTGLRPLSTEVLSAFPFFDSSTAVAIGGITYYPQATASTWQAEWRNNAQGEPLDVLVDWGDALLSRTYTTSSIVRIETTLKQDATVPGISDTMTAYKMVLLSGSGITELRGTDGTTYASAERNVFAINARLTITKIATDGGADRVVFDKAVYESLGATEEGGGSSGGAPPASGYAAELNMAGSAVYGYNFRLGSLTGIGDLRGQYRITFSLDPHAQIGSASVPNHVRIVGKQDAAATLSADGRSSSVVITVN